jgi:hypothetical protein
MAVALLGFFTTMVTAFVGLMFLLNVVLSSSFVQHTHPQPYPMPVVAEAATPDNQPAIGAETASVDQPKLAAVAKATHVKVARAPRRKEDLAGRRQDREYSLALGYAQDGPRQPGALFDVFGTRRF